MILESIILFFRKAKIKMDFILCWEFDYNDNDDEDYIGRYL